MQLSKLNIRLDICTLCNLNCPACSMRISNYGELGAGYVKFEVFKKFIDTNKFFIKRIEISNYGEPLLNPDLIKILEYAKYNNIDITCDNGTNLNIKEDDKLEALVKYGVKSITVSCDGVTQESYSKYRRNGDINLVFANIKKINEYKKKYHSEVPYINWQYVVRESSEDDIVLVKEKAKELEVNSVFFKLTWESDYKPKNPDKVKALTGLAEVTRAEYKAKHNISYQSSCWQLWDFPVINWDGRLLGCCRNKHPFNINVFDVGLMTALNNPQYRQAIDWFKGNADSLKEDNPCYICLNKFSPEVLKCKK